METLQCEEGFQSDGTQIFADSLRSRKSSNKSLVNERAKKRKTRDIFTNRVSNGKHISHSRHRKGDLLLVRSREFCSDELMFLESDSNGNR